ncbi:MAG: tetratricopeptide repeat protein [Candidatus Omnitrophica bacterium]|nr:tetratricopeptide repeat protein [Candidatus Omnitrophota bacterium]MDE2222903.1 tetratricopeptide repeat protein [Candidatus Omnitrophota bacterium]
MEIILSTMLAMFFLPSLGFASVAGDVNRANHLYEHGQFDDALDLYQKALAKDDKSPVVKYDLGTDFYKKGDYTKALEYLRQASQEKDLKIKSKAQYNLGNALFKSGVGKEAGDVNGALKTLQDSLGQYEQVIKDDPKDQDAVFNEGVVKKEIERLKRRQQQQQQRQQQNQQRNRSKKNQQRNSQNQHNQQDQENQPKQQKQNQQQGQQNRQRQQNQQEQPSGQAQPQSRQSQAGESPQELDRKQAEDMLEDYRENEEPRKLLNYMSGKIDTRPVLKDW